MKKTILLAVILLLLCALAVSVGAEEKHHPHEGDHCVCGGSAGGVEDHKCSPITWQPLPADTTDFSKLPSGNYYLTGDLTIKEANTWTNRQKISLCLNGYDINTTAKSVFYYIDREAVLNICDCSGTKDAQGNWHWDGTITANRTGGSCAYGGIFNLRTNALANIYGGNFVGATAPAANGAVFNVCHDGYNKNGLTYESEFAEGIYTLLSIYNGNFTGGTVTTSGGIINVWHNADVSIYGGTFSGGQAKNGGGVYLGKGDYVLKNCTITQGAATENFGNLFVYNANSLVMENCTITDGKAGKEFGNLRAPSGAVDVTKNVISGGSPEVARIVQDGTHMVRDYKTLEAALSAISNNTTQYVQILRDLESSAAIKEDVYLDLAGHTLSGITIEGKLYGMDSTTNGYDGSKAGRLIPAAGAPQTHVRTTAERTGEIYRYLCVEESQGYSFHRFYIGVTSVVLSPDKSGFGFKASFAGDEQVKNALDPQSAFGMAVGLQTLPQTLEANVYRGQSSRYFTTGAPFTKQIVISNILDAAVNNNSARSQMPVYARAYIRLADGTAIFSDEQSYTMRQAMEAVNENWERLSDAQKTATSEMLKSHEYYTSGWNVAKIHHHDTDLWKPWTGTWVSGGHYYLTEDFNLTSLSVAAGKTLDICLNGHDMIGAEATKRLINIKGVLNIHDHCDENGDYAGDVICTFSGEVIAPLFYVYERAVFNLCGGNLTRAEGTYAARGGVGIIGNGNANNDSGYMNIWNGTVSGGNVVPTWDKEAGAFNPSINSGNGGNIELVAYGILNIYDGKIIGGTATHGMVDGQPISKASGNGGNICVSSSSILNMYDGEITGGTSITQGNVGGLGGNIYNAGGKLNIYGGIIADGTTNGARGGNIYSTGKVHLENATVTGGLATELVLDGQTVIPSGLGDGIYTTQTISLKGDVRICDNQGQDLYLAEFAQADASALAETARIGICGAVNSRVSADPHMANRFYCNDPAYRVDMINGGAAVIPADLDTGLVDAEKNTFSVGYSMSDISPVEEGLIMSSYGNPNGRLSSGMAYRLYATTIAVTDAQDNTFLMITIDLQTTPEGLLNTICTRISQVTGVPAENIYISATHTHNVPSITTSSAKNNRYRFQLIDGLIRGALYAMEDRAPATMQTGSFDTQGMNYSRHYYYADENGNYTDEDGNKISYFGDQFGQAPADKSLIKRVREGDPTMHMLTFQRQGKQDVLLVNWRAHPHRSGGRTSYVVTADVIGALREYMHANTDYLFAYFQGAAGNMNTTSRISGQTYKSGKVKEYGAELGRQIVVNGLPKLQSVPTGLIHTEKVIYTAIVDHSEDDRYEDALIVQSYYHDNPDLMDTYEEQINFAAQYGFSGIFHASRLITKYNMGATKDLELNIFSIGDSVGFYTAPGELWDSVSEEMESRSPFATTFCVGYSNGNVAYIPYQLTYSSYEYHYCLFVQDQTILDMMNIYEATLKKQYGLN